LYFHNTRAQGQRPPRLNVGYCSAIVQDDSPLEVIGFSKVPNDSKQIAKGRVLPEAIGIAESLHPEMTDLSHTAVKHVLPGSYMAIDVDELRIPYWQRNLV
jgi:hypothetical protein